MKKRYTEEQVIKAMKQHEAGVKVDDICREMGRSTCTFYNWRSKYAWLKVNEAKRLRELHGGRLAGQDEEANPAKAAHGSANGIQSMLVYGLCVRATQQWSPLSSTEYRG
ncbi:transposase [Aeromonas sp. 1805]|jgi:uncharacterized protein YjcR|uniref:transposase n=1 Tax=Aeromonas sp. 1805 TaxID=2560028 RepID=UPI003460E782